MSRQLLLSLVLVITLWGCGSQSNQLQMLSVREEKMQVEVADSPQEWAKGLMYRKSLPENQGMLFVFPRPRRASFWMQNTFVPLSIAFLNREGKILEIRDMQPLDETPIMSWSDDVWFALEANQGWFEKKSIQAGERFEIEKIKTEINSLSVARP